MFSNKHVIVAMIVAPILAVLAYFAVDALVAEKPHAATQGQQYELLTKPNCRYESGLCSLVNGDVELDMELVADQGPYGRLLLHSSLPLEGAKIALASETDASDPINFSSNGNDPRSWQVDLVANPSGSQRLQIVVSIAGSLYYGQAPLNFFEYETSFGKDFRGEAIK